MGQAIPTSMAPNPADPPREGRCFSLSTFPSRFRPCHVSRSLCIPRKAGSCSWAVPEPEGHQELLSQPRCSGCSRHSGVFLGWSPEGDGDRQNSHIFPEKVPSWVTLLPSPSRALSPGPVIPRGDGRDPVRSLNPVLVQNLGASSSGSLLEGRFPEEAAFPSLQLQVEGLGSRDEEFGKRL